MGMFSKPKTPDYAKINEEAAAKEKAVIAEEQAVAKQSEQAALVSAESKRKAFYSGLTAVSDTEQRKKFLKAV